LPLYEKARIEVYLPDVDRPAYHLFLAELEQEFTYAFGGSSLIRGLDGHYLSRIGTVTPDRVNLLFTDAPFGFTSDFELLSHYVEELREAAMRALDEEAILVVVHPVHHSRRKEKVPP
jgi:hypothetical protein